MMPPRVVRTFDGDGHVHVYEGASSPPAGDGAQGDWAICLTAAGMVTFGPKPTDVAWPAGAVNQGPAGAAGPGIAPWAATTAYTAGQLVSTLGALYSASSAHTSSAAFRTDVALGRWTLLGGSSQGRIETADPAFLSGLSTWPLESRCYYLRVRGAGVVGRVGVEVGTQSGNLVVAAWANNGSEGRAAAPATLLSSSGSVAVPAVGYQTVALGATVGVADGDWLSLACDNTVARFRSLVAASGVGVPTGRSGYELLTGLALPATPAPVWAGNTATFWLDGQA